MTGLNRYAEGRDALPPRETPTITAVPPTVQLHPQTALMTREMPSDEPSPTDVAQLVPPVIPPMSAFAPIRDKMRDAAAAEEGRSAGAGGSDAPGDVQSGSERGRACGDAPAVSGRSGFAVPVPAPYPSPAARAVPAGLGSGAVPAGLRAPRRTSSAPLRRRTSSLVSRRSPRRLRRPAGGLLVVVGLMVALTGLTALNPGLRCRCRHRAARDRPDRRPHQHRAHAPPSGPRPRPGVRTAWWPRRPARCSSSPQRLITLPCLILPLVMGVVVGGIVTAVAATAYGLDWQPLSAVGFGSAAIAALFTAWWGPGGSSLRRGAHIAARNTFPPALALRRPGRRAPGRRRLHLLPGHPGPRRRLGPHPHRGPHHQPPHHRRPPRRPLDPRPPLHRAAEASAIPSAMTGRPLGLRAGRSGSVRGLRRWRRCGRR